MNRISYIFRPTKDGPETLLDLYPLGAELLYETVILMKETLGGVIHARLHEARHIGPFALSGIEANDI